MKKRKVLIGLFVLLGTFVVLAANSGVALASHISEDSTTVNLTTLDAADASAYRWDAVANFYDYYGVSDSTATIDLTTLSAEDASAYRWNALAMFYSHAK